VTPKDEIRFVVDSLREEARKWRRLSDEMERVKKDVAQLTLWPTAFIPAMMSALPNAVVYSENHKWLIGLLTGAAAEFDQIGAALDKAADRYEYADMKSAFDLSTIYGKRQN